jgi:hypothetical protein
MVGHPCMERDHHVFTRPTTPPPPHAGPILGPNLIPPAGGPPCDLPTSYITSRASIGECVPSHAAQEPQQPISLHAVGAQRASVPRECSASLLHQHRLASFTLQR